MTDPVDIALAYESELERDSRLHDRDDDPMRERLASISENMTIERGIERMNRDANEEDLP